MVYAVVARCPVFGGKAARFDATKAKAVNGVTQVIQIPQGVAVVATDFWSAKLARDALRVGGGNSAAEKRSSDELLAQYRELAAFAQFGSDLDEATKKQLERGKRITEMLKQGQYQPMDVEKQVVVIFAAVNGLLDDVKVEKVAEFEKGLCEYCDNNGKQILAVITTKGEMDAGTEKELIKLINDYKSTVEEFIETKDEK